MILKSMHWGDGKALITQSRRPESLIPGPHMKIWKQWHTPEILYARRLEIGGFLKLAGQQG